MILNADEFRAAGKLAAASIKKNSPLDDYKNVHLRVEDGRLRVRGTDGAVESVCHLEPATGEVGESWETMIDGERFGRAVGGLNGETVSAERVGTSIQLQGGSSKFKFPLIHSPPREFPALTVRGLMTIDRPGEFADAISWASFTAADVDPKKATDHLVAEVSSGQMRVLASDSGKANLFVRMSAAKEGAADGDVYVSFKHAKVLADALRLAPGPVEVSQSGGSVVWNYRPGCYVRTLPNAEAKFAALMRQIEGRFKKQVTSEVLVEARELQEAVKAGVILSPEGKMGAVVRVKVSEGRVVIEPTDQAFGTSTGTCDCVGPGEFTFVVDSYYLLGFLRGVPGESTVRVSDTTEAGPLMLQVDHDKLKATYIVAKIGPA